MTVAEVKVFVEGMCSILPLNSQAEWMQFPKKLYCVHFILLLQQNCMKSDLKTLSQTLHSSAKHYLQDRVPNQYFNITPT